MKIKTSELTGAALDWAVAKCEGWQDIRFYDGCEGGDRLRPRKYVSNKYGYTFNPSTDWAHAGPIIDREEITIAAPRESLAYWRAAIRMRNDGFITECVKVGPTPLIAAMRCYVASKLGDIVDIPEELCK